MNKDTKTIILAVCIDLFLCVSIYMAEIHNNVYLENVAIFLMMVFSVLASLALFADSSDIWPDGHNPYRWASCTMGYVTVATAIAFGWFHLGTMYFVVAFLGDMKLRQYKKKLAMGSSVDVDELELPTVSEILKDE